MDVQKFVRSCDVCQRNFENSAKPQGFLHPLPVPSERFQEISIDFAFFPKTTSGFDCLMVIVDRLTKLVKFIPCVRTITAEKVGELLAEQWCSQGMGRPRAITSDRDAKFTSALWTSMCNNFNIDLRMATARHQQTDGQAEIAVRTLKRTARKFASYSNKDWDRNIHQLQFALNDSISASTGFTPFYLAFGMHPRKFETDPTVSPAEADLVQLFRKNIRKARKAMEEAQERQAKHYNRRHRNFDPLKKGDYVMLSAEGISWDAYSGRPPTALPRMLGPFQVLELQQEDANVLLQLPETMSRVHPVFHRSRVRKYVNGTDEFPDRTVFPRPAPKLVGDDELFEVEEILGKRVRRNKTEYLVKWKGYPVDGPDGAKWVGYFPGDKTWDEDLHHIQKFDASVALATCRIGSNAVARWKCDVDRSLD